MKNQNLSLKILNALVLLGAAFSVSCKGVDEQVGSQSVVSDPQTEALESAMTVVSGQADDATGGTFALQTTSMSSKVAQLSVALFGDSARASNCGRAFDQACNTSVGTKSITYTDCAVGSRPFTLNGSVTLTYSNNSCLLNVGDSVVRTYDHTIAGPRGLSIETTSVLRADYRGTQIGGGGRLSHTGANSWTIDILGKHKIGSFRDRSIFDVSVRTTTPVAISGSLARSGRTVSSGALEVNHNRAQFTATYQVTQPLVWNSSCCHPVSGALSATYAGSLSGSGTVSFNGCGSADLTKDGVTRTLSIGYCE